MANEVISCADAKAQGLRHYFTGKLCKHGHISKRWTHNGVCYECGRLNTKGWNKLNLPRLAANRKRWRQNNPEREKVNRKRANDKWYAKPENRLKASIISRIYYEKNKDSISIKSRNYRNKNKEKLARTNKRWRTENADYVRQKRIEWAQTNPEKVLASRRNAKARRKNAEGTHTAADILEILRLQKGRCAYCREKLKKRHVDHIIAIARGGTNFRRNLQIACEPCNLAKGAKDPLDFARSLGKLL